MKQLNIVKKLFLAALICAAVSVNGQIHPLAFPSYVLGGTLTTGSNYYKDYVGLRFEVTAPAAIAGDKTYTTANDGSGATGVWGTVVTTPLVNVPIYMDTTADSFGEESAGYGLSPAAVATITSTTPHMIVVMWRGPEGSGAIDFACKAENAYRAGASAVVLINEYAGQGPVGMGEGSTCVVGTTPGTGIPVFMIGNLDGIAVSAQYRAGVRVTMSITPWGLGNTDDLGIIPHGGAFWHDYAIPSNQLSTNEVFKGLDGAFVANFGTSTASNLKLSGTLSFTPNGGSATVEHTDTVSWAGPFTAIDSIEAMFDTLPAAEYNLPTSPGVGRFDLTYNLSSSLVDQYLGDNALTYSFYTTDSLYSKGRYDFANNTPVFGEYLSFGTAPAPEYIWGPLYFVGSTPGTYIQKLQFSLFQNSTATPPTTVDLSGTPNVFIFKWVDTGSMDGIIENGELTLVSASPYNYSGTTPTSDTSGALLEIANNKATNFICDASGNPADGKALISLDANSWYYVAVDVGSTATFIGVDGVLDPFPRIYGRFHSSGTLDYSNFELTGSTASDVLAAGTSTFYPVSASSEALGIGSIDSFNYSAQKGAIPQVAMLASAHPDTTSPVITPIDTNNAVKNVIKSIGEISIYPNPTTDYLNVSVNLTQVAKTISYEIIDGLGRLVSKEIHNNVQNETFEISTNCLAPGTYYLAINANGQLRVNKFTVVR